MIFVIAALIALSVVLLGVILACLVLAGRADRRAEQCWNERGLHANSQPDETVRQTDPEELRIKAALPARMTVFRPQINA
jgi:hypothetical protein